MLDKSVPYIEIIMHREAGVEIPTYPLPEGYSFKIYEPGDEKEWARIETSVGEFDNEMDALLYFQKEFLPFTKELPRRMIFIVSPDGELIGTASAWWDYAFERRCPLVHWVAVKPGHQGKGLGKAITAEVVRLMTVVDGEGVFYLKTQTYSHKAIGIYEWAGFTITGEKGLFGYSNDRFDEAVKLIDDLRKKR